MAEGFTGMAELIADLENLPEEFKGEAANIVTATANGMATDVRSRYPSVSGNLRDHVVVERDSDGDPLKARVKNTARHSHLYERGTVERFQYTRKSKSVGEMFQKQLGKGNTGKPTFIPAAVRARARMKEQLVSMVKRSKVRGMTGTLDVVERGD